MLTPGPAMPATAKDADLVDKIAFFQNASFTVKPGLFFVLQIVAAANIP
jgi:hypothetical protein